MAKEQKTEEMQKLERSSEAVKAFLKLSSYLFGDNAPYDMNEIKEDSEYYSIAKELADEMEIDWQTMSHTDSNRIMLAMLDDYFQNIRDNEDERVKVEVKSILIEKKNAPKKEEPIEDKDSDDRE